MNKYERVPEKIVDLHGLTTREAKVIMDELLQEKNLRHVRIITGKGLHSGKGPVLRAYVQSYLQERGIGFSPAKLYHGGDGALEIFLY